MSNCQSSMVHFRSMLSGFLHKRLGIILISAFSAITSYADVGLLFPFTDHMVLQRGSATIWGTATPGERVTLLFRDTSTVAVANADGRWRAELNTGKAGGPFTLVAEGSNRVELEDVLVGEVWLGSGQSNMHMALRDGRGGVLNAAEEIAAANYPTIRLLQIPNGRDKHNPDFANVWAPCTPASAEGFSAALYFFARRLQQELGIPIGVVNASQGGSKIEPWLPESGNLYEKCIKALVPMSLQGLLWYQGESNARGASAFQYAENLTALITGWRAEWGSDLPFYAVQIAPCFAFGHNAHIVRDQTIQALFAQPHTGIISTFDIAELTNNHPRYKQQVGLRLANLALYEQYGKHELHPYCPRFDRMSIERDRATVFFQQVEGGLATSNGKAPDWFQIAGADRQFHWARTHINGSAVEVWHPDVSAPVAVQFAYDAMAVPNLIGKASAIPAMPMRSHDWPAPALPTEAIQLTTLPADSSPGHTGMLSALSKVAPLTLQSGGRPLAEFQLAIQGETLLVRATVTDALITPHSANWEGASIEFYTTTLEDSTVSQVVIPITGLGDIATAKAYQMGKEQPPVSLPLAQVEQVDDHAYRVTAILPLSGLGLSTEAKAFRMEVSATVAKEPGQTRDWYSMFGSIGAFIKSERYRRMEWN